MDPEGGSFAGLIRHKGIVGQVQHGCGGFGLSTIQPTWINTTAAERRKLS